MGHAETGPDGYAEGGLTRAQLLKGSLATGAALAFGGRFAQAALAASTPKTGGSVLLGMNDGPPGETLNPFLFPSFMELMRAQFTHDQLFRLGPNNAVIPQLAV